MRALVLGLLFILISIEPSAACHRFHIWRYPEPQRCDEINRVPKAAQADHSWYVEVVPKPVTPDTGDKRTPAEVQDFDEHTIALEKHKDELNKAMTILRVEEDAAHAAGIK